MLVYSDKLTYGDLENICEDLGIELHNADGEFYGARKRRTKLTLRPVSERFRAHSADPYCAKGYRRLWAVSYMGHWHFMARLLDIDPDARIKSAVADWQGREDFHARTPKLQDEHDQFGLALMQAMVG